MWEIFSDNRRFSDRPAVVYVTDQTTWGELYSLADTAFETLCGFGKSRVGIVCDASPESFAALAALDRCAANAFLLDSGKSAAEINELASVFRLDAVVRSLSRAWEVEHLVNSPSTAAPGVTILTSGTTGKPKAARHSWQTLCRPVMSLKKTSRENGDGERWLLTFRPQLYAGLQVTLHAFANAGALVVPPADCDTNGIVDVMRSTRVGHVSATPSFWRNILPNMEPGDMGNLSIRQITLGGELVDQNLLDQLKVVFPDARITHIYATTELGKCFSVTDLREGFPLSYLNQELPGGVELRVSNGQLLVRSENRMLEYDPLGSRLESAVEAEGWTATGDLVEIRDDRVIFVGRETDFINVGGYKVNPSKVEQVLRGLADVANIRVFGQTSSVTGQIVACEVVPSAGSTKETVLQAIRERAVEQLDRYHRPRIINIVDRIQLSPAGKVKRYDDPS